MNKVALYVRLSDEDRNKLTEDELSESIKNQEIILKEYAQSHNWQIVGTYNDEDYSGADSTRPNFNKMIKECSLGNINIILCKTQSRFARDLELIEKYIYNKFIEWNVRFVSTVDKIDNFKKETKKASQILGLTDEWYLEDTSNNIRQTFKAKRQSGKFTGSFAPYGYQKDPQDKNHLIIDPIAKETIIRIFNEYTKGYSLKRIVSNLTKDNILSPLEYKKLNGSKLTIPIKKNKVDAKNINKAGTFIIDVSFINNKKQIINNLSTIEYFTSTNNQLLNQLTITPIKIINSEIEMFYTTKNKEELNIHFKNDKLISDTSNYNNPSNWQKIIIGKQLPPNTTFIKTSIKQLEQMQKINYQFEITIKKSKNCHYCYNIYPSSKNKNINIDYAIETRTKYNWSEQTIKKILKDEVYIGNLVQFKTTTISYKNKTRIYNNKDTQIRVENTHKPIISKDIWLKSQERLNTKNKSCKNGQIHLLANKVFCKNCHKTFCKCGKNNKLGLSYLCCKDKNTKWSNCTNTKYIKQEELQNYILKKFNKLLKTYFKESYLKELNNSWLDKLSNSKIASLNKEYNLIQTELKSKNDYLEQLYIDRKNKFLDDDEYLYLKDKFKRDYENLNNRKKIISRKLTSINNHIKKLKDKTYIINKYKKIKELNINIINEFVDKIIIDKYDEKTNTRNIHIIWNFLT